MVTLAERRSPTRTPSTASPPRGSSVGDRFTTGFTGRTVFVVLTVSDTFLTVSGGLTNGSFADAKFSTATTNTLDVGAGGSVHLDTDPQTATGITTFANVTKVKASGGTLFGPAPLLDQTTWTITGPDTGTVDGTDFDGFANLTGKDGTSDAFVFAGGSISETIAGGTGAVIDGFAVVVGSDVHFPGSHLHAWQPGVANESNSNPLGLSFEGLISSTPEWTFNSIGGGAAPTPTASSPARSSTATSRSPTRAAT